MAYGPPPLLNNVIFEQQQQIAIVMGRQRTENGGFLARLDARRHPLRYVYDSQGVGPMLKAMLYRGKSE